jgi:5'-phosphate synthase pdxT subunit
LVTRVGVLAIQGDVAEHSEALRRAGTQPIPVRRPDQLGDLDALVLPGGESTTIGQLAGEAGLLEPLRRFVDSGRAVWGTCAGVILLADSVGGASPVVGGLPVEVDRNAFGRQVDSFEADVDVPVFGPPRFRAVFIRSPAIRVVRPGADVLARLDDGAVVAVRAGAVLGTVFHPELTDDLRWHRLFLSFL